MKKGRRLQSAVCHVREKEDINGSDAYIQKVEAVIIVRSPNR